MFSFGEDLVATRMRITENSKPILVYIPRNSLDLHRRRLQTPSIKKRIESLLSKVRGTRITVYNNTEKQLETIKRNKTVQFKCSDVHCGRWASDGACTHN